MSGGQRQRPILDFMAGMIETPDLVRDVTKNGALVPIYPPPVHLFEPDPSRIAAVTPDKAGVGGAIPQEKSALDRLVTRARLRPGARLLRVGWGWVFGKDDRGWVVSPLVSVPVERQGRLPRFLNTQTELGADFVAVGDVTPSELIDDARTANRVLDELVFASQFFAPGIDADWHEPNRDLVEWLIGGAAALGFDDVTVSSPVRNLNALRDADVVRVLPIAAFYLADDAARVTRSGVLEAWGSRTRDDPTSAFRSVYLGAPDRDQPPTTDVDIAAVALDPAQRRAVSAARRDPVSVVIGPPGTGKSHTVAAMAVDAVHRGERVLLATKTQQATSVLLGFLDDLGGPTPVVFGDNQSRADLADHLWQRVAEPGADERTTHRQLDDAVTARARRHRDTTESLDAEQQLVAGDLVAQVLSEGGREEALTGLADELAVLDDPGAGWWARRKASKAVEEAGGEAAVRLRIRTQELRDAGGLSLGPLIDQLIDLDAVVQQRFAAHVGAAIAGSLGRAERTALMALSGALRAGRSKRRDLLAAIDAEALLDATPLWAGTIADIEDLLPAELEMFDLVIVDEASQVDQLSAPPALLRAKRLVAVGDPNQLRHTSFLSDARLTEGLDDAEIVDPQLRGLLDLRRNSLLDVAGASGITTALSTHYRSAPHLIDFSAERFYDGRVQPATRHPGRDRRDCIDIDRVGGDRDEAGNAAEVAAVIAHLETLLQRGVRSVGVISPFRVQVDALEDQILRTFSDEQIDRLDLAVGTVHSFQGAERDHVVVSLVVDDESPGGSFSFLENRNLFNVMVTRARDHMQVVTSLVERRSGIVGDYLRHADEVPPAPEVAGAAGDWTRRVEAYLRDQGLVVRAGYPVGHEVVDLVVGDGVDAVALDCEVHRDGPDAHIRRRSLLRSMGWQIVDAFESRWGHDLGEFAVRLGTGDLPEPG
ncbi:MAG: AAA domain-containing protein [Actinomycetota bacterium]